MALDDLDRLKAMAARRAAALPAAPDADALAALERCKRCNYKRLCDDWLLAMDGAAPRAFCPNSGYIEYRRQVALRFTR